MFQSDLEKISDRLVHYEALVDYLIDKFPEESGKASEQMKRLALERGLEGIFNLFTDIAALLIDRFILRDPGSYEDMVDILSDEGILTFDEAQYWKEVIGVYRRLRKEYRWIEREEEILPLIQGKADILLTFPSKVHRFIEEERLPGIPRDKS